LAYFLLGSLIYFGFGKGKMRQICWISIVLLSQYNVRGEYTVEGTATFESASGSPKNKLIIFDITLESRGKEYRIMAKSLSDEWYNNETVGSDGIFDYFLEQDWNSLDDKKRDKNNYQEFGKVGAGVFPQYSATPVQLVWLAYCSSSYLVEGTNSMKIPLFNTRYAPTDGMMEIVSFAENNRLEKIQCFATNILYIAAKKTNIWLKAPYDKGYLLWQLKITGYTNIGQTTLPFSFEYEQYFPKTGSDTNSANLNRLYKGWFTAANFIGTVSSGSLLPMATKNDVRVADWSHNLPSTSQGTPVVASVLNGNNWNNPTNPTAKYQAFAINQVISERSPQPARKSVKIIIIALLAVNFLFLCRFICREIKRKQTNKNN
jgi:hypothetical protein